MDSQLEHLYKTCPTLDPRYVREILGLTGEKAVKVDKITGGIHKDEAELLAHVVDEIKPVTSIEVGLGYGFSALTILLSGHRELAKRTHIVMDPHQSEYWHNRGLQHIERAGVAKAVEFHEDMSYRVLPKLEARGVIVDFAFIDGWHTFDFAFVDFFYVDKLLRPGGVVMFDDANWPSIKPVIHYALTNLNYKIFRSLPGIDQPTDHSVKPDLSGSAIAIGKPLEPLKREIFNHIPFGADNDQSLD